MRSIASITILVIALSSLIQGQATPDFSGKWTGGRPMANLYGVAGPTEMVIRQSASTLTIDRPYGDQRVSISLRLDGTPSKNMLDPGVRPGVTHFVRELVSTATWEDRKLKVVTKSSVPLGAKTQLVVTIETFSLDDGDLVVERNDGIVGADFNHPVDGKMISLQKDIYKKAAK